MLTAYPELMKMLDYDSLGLKHFFPGALIRYNDKTHVFADPFRKPTVALASFFAPIANMGDRLKILAIRNRTRRLSIEQIFRQKEQPTIDYLREWNFSEKMIHSFFKPFFGGIFLEENLQTSSRMFEFVFKMFSQGYAALPAEGIEAIPKQLAERLEKDSLSLNTKVVSVKPNEVILENGEVIATRAILIATQAESITQMLDYQPVKLETNSVKCLYFSTDRPPFTRPFIMLNGENTGYINNICVPSVINPSYAPAGRHLISVSIIKDTSHLEEEELLLEVKRELRQWFKKEIRFWDFLKMYDIPQALPQKPEINLLNKNEIQPIQEGIYLAGDHLQHASIQGAMESARIVTNAISWDLALSNSN
jgi:protoporphyrinogen oxidase